MNPDTRPTHSTATRDKIAPPLIAFGLFIGTWYAISALVLPPQKQFLLPRPDVVLTDAFLTWDTGQQRGMKSILLALWDTTQVAVIGLMLTSIIGIGLALAMSFIPWIARATWPYLVAIQAAPIIAMTPLIRALIENSDTQRIVVVVLIAFFPITSASFYGLTTVPRLYHDLFTLHNASRWQRLFRLQIPHALPAVFLGLRTSAGLAVVGAVVGDFYFRQGGQVGIGAQIDLYRAQLWGAELVASVLMASSLGIAFFVFFSWLSTRLTGHWHQPPNS